eukprot:315806-Pelagomonas_calceolata.AAC.1
MVNLRVSWVIYTLHTMKPLIELGLDTHEASNLFLKPTLILSSILVKLPASDALVRRLLPTLLAGVPIPKSACSLRQ